MRNYSCSCAVKIRGLNWIQPKISIIIPTLNGAESLAVLLKQITLQTVQVQEIVVVDSQSTDNTVKVAQEFGAEVLTVEKSEFDHGGTRNWAADRASGDVLVFMTQDAIPADRYTLAKLIQSLWEPEIILTYARQIPYLETIVTDKFLRKFNYPEQGEVRSEEDIITMGIKAFKNSNVCAAYRAKEFEELGGFHAPVVSNEDMLFAAKAIIAGYKVAYAAEALVWHSHNYSCWSLFKRYFDIGASLDYAPVVKLRGKSESAGFGFMFSQLRYIIKQRKFLWIPRAWAEAGFKYAGYKLGTKHQRLPNTWKKRLGLHKEYWKKQE